MFPHTFRKKKKHKDTREMGCSLNASVNKFLEDKYVPRVTAIISTITDLNYEIFYEKCTDIPIINGCDTPILVIDFWVENIGKQIEIIFNALIKKYNPLSWRKLDLYVHDGRMTIVLCAEKEYIVIQNTLSKMEFNSSILMISSSSSSSSFLSPSASSVLSVLCVIALLSIIL